MGVDANPDAVQLVKSGDLAATVFQDAVGQGEGAMDIINNILEGKDQESIKWIDFLLVTPENVEDFE